MTLQYTENRSSAIKQLRNKAQSRRHTRTDTESCEGRTDLHAKQEWNQEWNIEGISDEPAAVFNALANTAILHY